MCLVLQLGAAVAPLAAQPSWVVSGSSGMVASDSAEASQAGLEILKLGGNAFDAAAAVSFALGVTRPYSTGPGGGGFAIARLADGTLLALDYRETAPAAATESIFADATNRQQFPHPSRIGGLAVAIPGSVAGQCQMLSEHGTLPLARVLQPAIRLARQGFPVDEHYREACDKILKLYEEHPTLKTRCRLVYELHLNKGQPHPSGALLKQPQLASFLERLAAEGPGFFYEGAFSHDAVSAIHRSGGILTAVDFKNYRVRSRTPLLGNYRGYTIVTMPPPSSGGVALLQTLNILELLDLRTVQARNPHDTRHLIIEAMKHAFADRARWLGDADFGAVPTDWLTSKAYAATLAPRLQLGTTGDPSRYGSAQLPEDGGTSHYCVVDRFGNAVSATETINTEFGSLVAVESWGVILNNEMDDFAAEPGRPNAFGLTQSQRNAVAPGKRPLSSMCPTLVLREGDLQVLLGGSGGPRIISSVLQVLVHLLDFRMDLAAAVRTPRLHHQWQPDEVYFDQPPPADVVEDLRRRGHVISQDSREGVVQIILKNRDHWTAASDPRKGGRPAGY